VGLLSQEFISALRALGGGVQCSGQGLLCFLPSFIFLAALLSAVGSKQNICKLVPFVPHRNTPDSNSC